MNKIFTQEDCILLENIGTVLELCMEHRKSKTGIGKLRERLRKLENIRNKICKNESLVYHDYLLLKKIEIELGFQLFAISSIIHSGIYGDDEVLIYAYDYTKKVRNDLRKLIDKILKTKKWQV